MMLLGAAWCCLHVLPDRDIASVSDSDISEAESTIELRLDGTSDLGRDGVGPPTGPGEAPAPSSFIRF